MSNRFFRMGGLALTFTLLSSHAHAQVQPLAPLTLKGCTDPQPELPKESERALLATVVISTKAGVGSGFLISPDGFILTAAHVVSEDTVRVAFKNGSTMQATVLRLDEANDVALLRLVDLKLPTPCLHLSTEPATIGEEVYALGSPAGTELSFSISRGIVSGVRTIKGGTFLQTDAAINPGNSGGPLMGVEGKVRAIASWKVAGLDMEGLGFGVPSATAMTRLGIQMGDSSDSVGPSFTRKQKKKKSVAYKPQVIDYPDYSPAESYPETHRAGWVFPVRFSGYVLVGVGTGAIIGSWISHLNTSDAQNFGTNRAINTTGWIAAGTGAGMVVASYVWGKPSVGPTKEGAQTPSPRVELSMSGSALSLSGAY